MRSSASAEDAKQYRRSAPLGTNAIACSKHNKMCSTAATAPKQSANQCYFWRQPKMQMQMQKQKQKISPIVFVSSTRHQIVKDAPYNRHHKIARMGYVTMLLQRAPIIFGTVNCCQKHDRCRQITTIDRSYWCFENKTRLKSTSRSALRFNSQENKQQVKIKLKLNAAANRVSGWSQNQMYYIGRSFMEAKTSLSTVTASRTP